MPGSIGSPSRRPSRMFSANMLTMTRELSGSTRSRRRTPAALKSAFHSSGKPVKSKPRSGVHPTCVTCVTPVGSEILLFLELERRRYAGESTLERRLAGEAYAFAGAVALTAGAGALASGDGALASGAGALTSGAGALADASTIAGSGTVNGDGVIDGDGDGVRSLRVT